MVQPAMRELSNLVESFQVLRLKPRMGSARSHTDVAGAHGTVNVVFLVYDLPFFEQGVQTSVP